MNTIIDILISTKFTCAKCIELQDTLIEEKERGNDVVDGYRCCNLTQLVLSLEAEHPKTNLLIHDEYTKDNCMTLLAIKLIRERKSRSII